jgi:hypothetical protein
LGYYRAYPIWEWDLDKAVVAMLSICGILLPAEKSEYKNAVILIV